MNEIILKHLHSKIYHINGVSEFSSLAAALRDARDVTGRNIETGDIETISKKLESWLGVAAYFIVLDQIGECYKNNLKQEEKRNSVWKALKYFTNLKDIDINAFYGLRCCILHDYSIIHVAKDGGNKKSSYKPHYTFRLQNFGPLIEHASIKWEGDFTQTRTTENETKVNVIEFGNLVENIYYTVCKLFVEGNLELVLSGGENELEKRYFMFSKKID